MFTWDLVDPVRIGSAIRYQMGLLGDSIWNRTVPVSNRSHSHVNRVDPYHIVDLIPNGSDLV